MSDPQWTVTMKIERYITVTVEAPDERTAKAKAEMWDIEGDECPGDTINVEVIDASRDD
jgi:hypothetical protein